VIKRKDHHIFQFVFEVL